jgi:hypothetical protein
LNGYEFSVEVDFLEKNPLGGCGSGLHRSRKCHSLDTRASETTALRLPGGVVSHIRISSIIGGMIMRPMRGAGKQA